MPPRVRALIIRSPQTIGAGELKAVQLLQRLDYDGMVALTVFNLETDDQLDGAFGRVDGVLVAKTAADAFGRIGGLGGLICEVVHTYCDTDESLAARDIQSFLLEPLIWDKFSATDQETIQQELQTPD